MKFGVIVFPGSNCDMDCYYILKDVLHQKVDYLWHKDSIREDYDCLILPGGFSYGDYLRAGAIARFSPIMSSVIEFAKKGKLILGICNGFQILLEAKLLPGAMIKNNCLQFVCKYIRLTKETRDTPFTNFNKIILTIPIAHGEGHYLADKDTLKMLQDNDQIVFRYCDEKGHITESANPNGSVFNIAGIVNKQRTILGMMPHPERCSEKELGSMDGKLIFESIINYLA